MKGLIKMTLDSKSDYLMLHNRCDNLNFLLTLK